MDFTKYWNIFWTLTFALTSLVITIGNLITIVIFLKQKLRKRPHFLLISLAFADVMVGAFAVPLYIAVGICTTERLLVLSLQCVDIFTGFLSIFTLASISLERMHAILWPLRHRTLTSRFYTCVIGIPWIVAHLGILARVLLHFYIISKLAFVVIIIVSLTSPLLFTCAGYFLIWRKQKTRLHLARQADRDDFLTKTLFIVSGSFVVTWLPFHIINIIASFCASCQGWPFVVFHLMKLLQFGNSFVNVVIYPLRITEYKKALFEMFLYCLCSSKAPRKQTSIHRTSGRSSSSLKSCKCRSGYVSRATFV